MGYLLGAHIIYLTAIQDIWDVSTRKTFVNTPQAKIGRQKNLFLRGGCNEDMKFRSGDFIFDFTSNAHYVTDCGNSPLL